MNIKVGNTVRVKGTDTTFVVEDIFKEGRWEYASDGSSEKYTLGKLEIVKSQPKAKEGTSKAEGRVGKVKQEVEPKISAEPFNKFRAAHKPVMNAELGRRTQDCGDDIATTLLQQLAKHDDNIYHCPIVKKHFDVVALEAQYAHLNPGMQRMNIGNRLRKILRESSK